MLWSGPRRFLPSRDPKLLALRGLCGSFHQFDRNRRFRFLRHWRHRLFRNSLSDHPRESEKAEGKIKPRSLILAHRTLRRDRTTASQGTRAVAITPCFRTRTRWGQSTETQSFSVRLSVMRRLG